jgi:cysteine synthase B
VSTSGKKPFYTEQRVSADVVDAIGNTPLVEISRMSPNPNVRIYAKLEGCNPTGSVKDRIAKYMIEHAIANGDLTPGKIMLEATSGNTGIGMAMICRRKGYQLCAVMPESVSVERRDLLKIFGAEIVLSPGNKGTNGAIEVAWEMSKDDRYFMPYQFGNPANPLAHYETTGPEIVRDMPEVDVFVAGIGTGGTLMGVGKRLREHNPNVKLVGVEPVLGESIQGLRNIEDGFIPPIFDVGILDSKFIVRNQEAFIAARELTRAEGVFAGISAGAAVLGAVRVARKMDKGNIVVLLADGGWKYLSTGLWTSGDDTIDESINTKLWW